MVDYTRPALTNHGLAAAPPPGKTYVLVHGAWHGGWCWREVVDALRAMGHRVSAPTQTGVGERKHLLSKNITLDTFAADVINHIEAEELDNVILVGHSLGGVSITCAADKIPGRIRHMVYLDSYILQNNQSVFDILPPEVVAARRKLVAEEGNNTFIPPPSPAAFGIPDEHRLADWVRRRLTPHPVSTYETPMRIEGPVGNNRPCTYIVCTNPCYGPLEATREWAKRQQGWSLQEIATAHDAMVTAPEELARMLAQIG